VSIQVFEITVPMLFGTHHAASVSNALCEAGQDLQLGVLYCQ